MSGRPAEDGLVVKNRCGCGGDLREEPGLQTDEPGDKRVRFSHYDQHPDEVLKGPSRRRAARLRAAPRERFDREEIFERDEWICGICGKPVNEGDASLDHIVPLALGGAHTRANVRLAHIRCNSRRGAGKPSGPFPSTPRNSPGSLDRA